MKKLIYIIFFLLFASQSHAHTSHYKGIKVINMEIFRNNEIIGYSNYFFKHNQDAMIVENYTKFTVELFGLKVFSIDSKSKEIYQKGRLMSFESATLQNDKKKFVKLNYDKNKNKFIINGSSYVGEANHENIIGNWWNAKILYTNSQISPLSGSIKKQKVKLVNKDQMEYKGQKIKLFQFKLKSTENLPDDKKLDFDIWLYENKGIIFKVKYNRLGSWEYRLKKYE